MITKMFILFVQVTVVNDVSLAATWAETGTVYIYDFSAELNMVDDQNEVTNYVSTKNSVVQAFSGHQTEGFALDWSPTVKGKNCYSIMFNAYGGPPRPKITLYREFQI